IWTVKDAGTTGATIVNGNRMNTTDVGTAVLTATIVNGRGTGVDFVKDFPIAVGSAPFVAVESIAGLPSEATVGEPLVLTGTVMPSDATNKTIEWDIAEAAFTGAKITGGNIFEATSGGTVVISATVRNGSNNGTSDYVRSFTVTVKEPPMFIPVEDIIGLPSATMAGSILTLAGTVDPPDATNQTIRWDIKDAGTTGATRTGNLLRTETAGYVVMTATISSGLAVGVDYVQEFGISVSGGTPPQFKPVTNITGIPTTIMEKVWTSLVGTVVPSDATNKIIVWSVEDNDIGAVINAEKQLYAEAAGTVKVTATIANGLAVGTPYTKDFTIEIQSSTAPFVQVTGITGWTDKVGVGLETELGGTVQPPNATYKDIKWSLVNDTDGTLVDGVLKATEVGTVTVIATVVNGLGDGEDYVSEPITINVVPVYTVEFDLAGGTRTGGGQTEQIVMAGGSATAPTLAARTGYKFDGWDKVFTNVNDDLLVKAIWTATGGGGGGTGGSTNHGKQPGSSATITDPVTPLDPEPGDTGDTGDTGNDPVVRPPVDGNTGNSGNNTVVGIDDGDKVPLGDVPKTGMDNMMIIFALLGMSLATMLATRFVRRKGTN
ncbi:MAG: InlB B-repeat-containing protein, partial [Clostridiales bacterium]|nr:InlB B-repeat-containing protein [Clostridiales bacterium]